MSEEKIEGASATTDSRVIELECKSLFTPPPKVRTLPNRHQQTATTRTVKKFPSLNTSDIYDRGEPDFEIGGEDDEQDEEERVVRKCPALEEEIDYDMALAIEASLLTVALEASLATAALEQKRGASPDSLDEDFELVSIEASKEQEKDAEDWSVLGSEDDNTSEWTTAEHGTFKHALLEQGLSVSPASLSQQRRPLVSSPAKNQAKQRTSNKSKSEMPEESFFEAKYLVDKDEGATNYVHNASGHRRRHG